LAIWFHDAVYDPKAADNEERSANMAKLCLAEAGLETSLTTTLISLIMATKSHLPTDPDSRVLVDVDLSIFGQGDARFFDYEKQIRLEYLWVPQTVFNSKRAEILQRFLDREHIFQTASFRKRYETQARKNLQRSIARLKSLD
jgi:predicted metal-dependent HD superfamily phosphohydrolase